jgi:hypothetical protein
MVLFDVTVRSSGGLDGAGALHLSGKPAANKALEEFLELALIAIGKSDNCATARANANVRASITSKIKMISIIMLF